MKKDDEDRIESWERPLLKLAAEWLEAAVGNLSDGDHNAPDVQLTFSREQGALSVLVVTDGVMGDIHIAALGPWQVDGIDVVEPEVLSLSYGKIADAIERALRHARKSGKRYAEVVREVDQPESETQ